MINLKDESKISNSTFLLKIKLHGNSRKVRKDVRCFSYEKVVDCDLIYYMDFIRSIVEQYLLGYLEVKCDKESMSMFDKQMQKKVVQMFIAYCAITTI